MKNSLKLKAIYRIAGFIALAAVIGFSLAACGGGGNTVTYIGSSSDGTTYQLKILENTSRYAAARGDNYVLDSDALRTEGKKTSSGAVTAVEVVAGTTTITLQPTISGRRFTATVSAAGLVRLIGTITWNDTQTRIGPGSLTGGGMR